jgi:hypothetical protein
MFSLKEFIKKTPLINVYILVKKLFVNPASQNDEDIILDRLINRYRIPNTFIELGFSGWEFNCAKLANSWSGVLVDGDPYNVKIGNLILPKNITIVNEWLTLDKLGFIRAYAKNKEIGILSIDLDGNDFWFWQSLIDLRPALLIAEYNSTFGLRPITVPYNSEFDSTKNDEAHTYFGASLSAINHLATKCGYSLIEIGNTGVNAFFIRNDYLTSDDLVLKPDYAFREKLFSDGSRPSQRFEKIKDQVFVDVSKL